MYIHYNVLAAMRWVSADISRAAAAGERRGRFVVVLVSGSGGGGGGGDGENMIYALRTGFEFWLM